MAGIKPPQDLHPRNNCTPAESTGVKEAAQDYLLEQARAKVTTEMVAAAMAEWERLTAAGRHDVDDVLRSVYAAMQMADPIHRLLPKGLSEEHMGIYLAGLEMGLENAAQFQEVLSGQAQ